MEESPENSTSHRAHPAEQVIPPVATTPAAHVVVLFGGRSAEHDVSCVTASHVLQALDRQRYAVTVIGIDRSGTWHLAEAAMHALEVSAANESGARTRRALVAEGRQVAASMVLEASRASGLPVVVLPLLHGPQGEDGTIQGLLELLDLAYVGTGVLGSALAMDKAMAKTVLAAAGIAQPRHHAIHESGLASPVIDRVVEELGLPLFVKPANMGSSIGVHKARTRAEVEVAIADAREYDPWILLEEAVVGREIEVAVLGNEDPRASLPGEIVPAHEFYDYDDKYISSGAQLLVPAPLSDAESSAVRSLAIEVFTTLRGSGLARVDFFYEENGRGFLCNEMNTMPGFTPISMYPKLWQATGLSYSTLIDRLIEFAFERHLQSRRKTER